MKMVWKLKGTPKEKDNFQKRDNQRKEYNIKYEV